MSAAQLEDIVKRLTIQELVSICPPRTSIHLGRNLDDHRLEINPVHVCNLGVSC